MARWSDEFRANAVIMLESTGYPERKGGLSQVAGQLGVPLSTLARWYRGRFNPPPVDMVNGKRQELKDLLRVEIEAALGEMGSARQDASYRDLGTVVGILFDKLQLLAGGATANTAQRIVIEYAEHDDIITEAAAVADGRYPDGETV